jgi:hypothetical protein
MAKATSPDAGAPDGTSPASDAGIESGPSDTGTMHDSPATDAPSTCGAPGQPCCSGMTCTGATSCISNVCTCPEGSTACGAACVDEQTDDSNCGGCGLTCSAGCKAGECTVTLATGNVLSLAVDDTDVYWTDFHSIFAIPKDGGTKKTLASVAGGPQTLVVDATNVYSLNAQNSITSVPKAGGTVVTLASSQNLVGTPELALDSANVYWVSHAGTAMGGTVLDCAKTGCGGTPTTLASGQAYASGAIAVDATSVYWGLFNGTTGDLVKASLSGPPDGGPPSTTVATDVFPDWITIDGSTVYMAQDGMVQAVSSSGGSVTTVLTGADALEYAVDGSTIYFVQVEGSGKLSILKQPLAGLPDGGAPTQLAAGLTGVTMIVVDATSVYWGTYGGGSASALMRVTPK